ncbi:Ig-like domain-containing domain [Dinghuibacter silviterrae]|uniref:Ig-like domain-containing protein n=1 Tax=Dinghuibacter silviterrae TaxID=1539049 RepID=A0A4V3GLK8_9BACT|nr:Ig-like domain-containing domain [Dinghuibacter silviterrae]TDW99922.1 Ig-like domain-containing protein [Dinghuibacter silviterrae]
MQRILLFAAFCALVGLSVFQSGCARIVPPSGGPRDSLPPVLVKADPGDSALNQPLTGLKITLTFNEYIQLDNAAQNLIVNPTVKMVPVTQLMGDSKGFYIKMKDTLEPNATYTLNFGKAVKDVNEGNVLRNFTYIFSTGRFLDSGTLQGRVRLARTSKVDSTLLVILHPHGDDSAVAKETPRYVARLDSAGRFRFDHIATGEYSIFALKDVGDKKYHDKSELFAFYDHRITVTSTPNDSIVLYAYAEEAPKPKAGSTNKENAKKPAKKEPKEHKLHLALSIAGGKQDLLSPLFLQYDQPILKYDSTQLRLTDTLYNPLPFVFLNNDTTHHKFGIDYHWHEDSAYKLIVGKTFATDTTGVTLLKGDTITFLSKRESEYGSLVLRLHNFDYARHPVLQFVQSDKIVDSIKVTGPTITRDLYHPGDYELRVLYDTNQNGTWDPGSYFGIHRQPEIVVQPKVPKIKVRGNGWENEYDVTL